MIGLCLSALMGSALVQMSLSETTTESGQCEDYGEKVADADSTSTLNRDDPCFGYGYSCCTGYASEYCYWKDTYNCNNCELDIGYGGCSACCDSYDNTEDPTSDPTPEPTDEPTESPTEEETPSPTMHSAKKWERLHPEYNGGDGELLWNIYYGDFSDDERFDGFRNDQLWDAAIIRPMIEMDSKYERFQEGVSVHWSASETTSSATTESGQCEDYGEKVEDTKDLDQSLARADPCFGYGYNCCTDYASEYCYWKDTYNCNNCELDIGYGGCSACCDSYDNTEDPTSDPTPEPTDEPTDSPTEEETPSPTMHSAKKWEMLHPEYNGGDGELLWNIYYGEFSEDQRFDAFRKDQLWDAQVIRPMIEMDDKYQRFQLAHESVNVSSNGKAVRFGHYQWLILAVVIISIGAFAAFYRNRSKSLTKSVNSEEADSLLVGYGSTRK